MEVKPVLALPKGLKVVNITVMDEVLTIPAVSTQMHPTCPLCASEASRLHSHNIRQVADVPCGGQRVRLILHVRKFFCDVTTCVRKILWNVLGRSLK